MSKQSDEIQIPANIVDAIIGVAHKCSKSLKAVIIHISPMLPVIAILESIDLIHG
jgi:hypothetical protein